MISEMEYNTRIYKRQRLVVETVRGEVTVEELRDKFLSLFRNPEYDDSMRGLCDLRKASSRMQRSDFEQLAEEVESTSCFGQTRWAILTDDPMLTAFAQIFQRRVGEDGNIQIFSTLEAAEDYIGVHLGKALNGA